MTYFDYALRVGALSILATVSQLILPEGRMRKVCKTVFSVLIMIGIISPIGSLSTISFDFGADDTYWQVDTEALSTISDIREFTLEKECEQELANEGISDAGVDIHVGKGEGFNVEKVVINLQNAVIDGNSEHININVKAAEIVQSILLIDKELIVYE